MKKESTVFHDKLHHKQSSVLYPQQSVCLSLLNTSMPIVYQHDAQCCHITSLAQSFEVHRMPHVLLRPLWLPHFSSEFAHCMHLCSNTGTHHQHLLPLLPCPASVLLIISSRFYYLYLEGNTILLTDCNLNTSHVQSLRQCLSAKFPLTLASQLLRTWHISCFTAQLLPSLAPQPHWESGSRLCTGCMETISYCWTGTFV